VRIRRAAGAEVALLAAIHASAFPPGEAWGEDTMARLLALPGVHALLAEEAGLLLLRQAADEAEVLTLAVRPEARRQGVARALLETGAALLAAAGAAVLLLEVAEENRAALALYAGLGFVDAARRPDYYAPGRHARLLRLDLGEGESG
jgi:ribosomal-protein-alanine N-acetyltransferase